MARALVGGLIEQGWAPASVTVSDPSAAQRDELALRYPGVGLTASNADAVARADIVVFAVKPQVLAQTAREVAPVVGSRRPLVISIAAGIRMRALRRWLGGDSAIVLVRAMPNTPAMIGAGVTGLCADASVGAEERSLAERVLGAVGQVLWLEREDDMDAVTAVSGSGPAYFFLMLEALEKAALGLGLAPATARQLSVQTCLGAARLASGADESPEVLRARVTSKGGTTEQAISVFEAGGFKDLVARAVTAAAERGRSLSDEAEVTHG